MSSQYCVCMKCMCVWSRSSVSHKIYASEKAVPFENSSQLFCVRNAANQWMNTLMCVFRFHSVCRSLGLCPCLCLSLYVFINCFQPSKSWNELKKNNHNNNNYDDDQTGFICQSMNYTFNINDAPAANCFVINSDFYQLNADRKLQNCRTQYTKTLAHMCTKKEQTKKRRKKQWEPQ